MFPGATRNRFEHSMASVDDCVCVGSAEFKKVHVSSFLNFLYLQVKNYWLKGKMHPIMHTGMVMHQIMNIDSDNNQKQSDNSYYCKLTHGTD